MTALAGNGQLCSLRRCCSSWAWSSTNGSSEGRCGAERRRRNGRMRLRRSLSRATRRRRHRVAMWRRLELVVWRPGKPSGGYVTMQTCDGSIIAFIDKSSNNLQQAVRGCSISPNSEDRPQSPHSRPRANDRRQSENEREVGITLH